MNHLPGTVFELLDEYQWSGPRPVPEINTRVRLLLNGWEGCTGTIVGYRLDAANPAPPWLGVCIHVDKRPEWHRKEFPDRDVVYMVGREIERM